MMKEDAISKQAFSFAADLRRFTQIIFSRICVSSAFHLRLKKTIFILWLLFGTSLAHAAKIGDLRETDWLEQAARFWSLSDPAVVNALIGSVLMGVCCGLLGAFIVVRKLSLMGDTLSHAVMPGVALGFLWAASKNPLAIFIGATLAGLAGTWLVGAIKKTTPVKEDGALGMVLAGFYAVGICLFVMIQRSPTGNKSGIDKFLFGQAAALSTQDLWLMGIVTACALLAVALFYKELLTTSFDVGFARSSGMATGMLHSLLMSLLAFAVVISLQATGVVLVSAMLITPAATAYLLTDRMGVMLTLAALIGVGSAVLGAFLSFLGHSLPTGPFMVVGAGVAFTVAYFAGPRHGLITRWFRQASRRRRVRDENTLKALYHLAEQSNFAEESFNLGQLAAQRNESLPETEERAAALARAGFATVVQATENGLPGTHRNVQLTPSGWRRASEVVRNHRLWELYLTNAAQYAADHVHDDAERVEHILGEEIVRELEKRLNYPQLDPHGKPIPQTLQPAPAGDSAATGYRQPGS